MRRVRLTSAMTRGRGPASPERLDLARRSGLLIAGLGSMIMPAWSVADLVLEPSHAAAFITVRAVCLVPMLACLLLLWLHPFGRRQPELLTWAVLSIIQCVVAWMVPQVENTEVYLLGLTLALYGSGCLMIARPLWTAALIGTSWTAFGTAVSLVQGTLPVEGVLTGTMFLATASVIALVAHDQRARLAARERDARTRLEREQQRTRVLLQRLERLSNEDALTGLANRRAWDEQLTAAGARAEVDGTPVAVILVDVDHFKQVNDRYGHAGGDAALREVAALLASRVRGGDLVARLGGDELAVLLPGADVARAVALAEQLRADAATLRPPGFDAGAITLSLGVAVAAGQVSGERLMHDADDQLYRAKTTRNAVGAPSLSPAC